MVSSLLFQSVRVASTLRVWNVSTIHLERVACEENCIACSIFPVTVVFWSFLILSFFIKYLN